MRGVLITWAAAWPTITALLFALERMLGDWPLVLRTLLLTGLMVPLMSLLIVPALTTLLDRLLMPYQKVCRADALAVYASQAHPSYIRRAYVNKASAHRAGPALARRGFAP